MRLKTKGYSAVKHYNHNKAMSVTLATDEGLQNLGGALRPSLSNDALKIRPMGNRG